MSISDSHYLHNVVGDTEVRKGEGMQLSQLIPDSSLSRETNMHIQPFGLDILKEAFQLKETAPLSLPPSEKGTPTIPGKYKNKSKDKEKKHKDKDKKKEREKHKHKHKDRSKDKEKKKDKSGHQDSGHDHSQDITRRFENYVISASSSNKCHTPNTCLLVCLYLMSPVSDF